MEYHRMFLSVFVPVMAAIGLVNGDCDSDILNCGASSPINPGNLAGLSLNTINTVCRDTTSTKNAVISSKCVFGVMASDACKGTYGDQMANLPNIDWDRVLSSFLYVCENEDAFIRAQTCVTEAATETKYTHCVNRAVNSNIARMDRSKFPEQKVLKAHCNAFKGQQDHCLTDKYLPNCQAGDLEVLIIASLKAMPPTCAASVFESLNIVLLILFALIATL